jgi:hypothetical protein
MKTASWVLLVVVGVLALVGSILSASLAYQATSRSPGCRSPTWRRGDKTC